ncbi:MAG: head GIN domain-containing protein [Bacteroidales bacterium]|nr:head GIN domain-containing protein [Bacteroidales bacterium]
MKKSIKFIGVALFLFSLISVQLMAQISGSGTITSQSYDVSHFDRIVVGGALHVVINQSDVSSVTIEADDNLFNHIDVNVKDNVLEIRPKHIKSSNKLMATISLPELKSLKAEGATDVKGSNVLEGSDLGLDVSGAAKVHLVVKYLNVTSQLSGASKLTLEGHTLNHTANISGASKLIAGEMETENSTIHASGASNAKVSATSNLDVRTSGASSVKFDKQPLNYNLNDQTYKTRIPQAGPKSGPSADSVNVTVGNVKVQVIEGDTTRVNVGGLSIIVDEKGNVNIDRKKRHKFNGHWAGVELGLNGYLNSDFNMSFPAENSYLDLRMEKSINVNLNFYEQNIALNKSGTFGLVSGLGLSWNNYRFSNNTYLSSDSSEFKGYLMEGVSVKKSKLVNLYLTLPLYFELQSKGTKTKEKLHFAAGVVAGWRISSHTKLYFNEANKDFSLRDLETDKLLPIELQTPGNNNRNITKDYASFHQRPFKLDASVRAGWGIINLYANYSLTSMFIKDKGPELYPFAVGICLSGW